MTTRLQVKVCGLREPDNIAAICSLRPEFIGFNFYPQSKRFFDRELPSLRAAALAVPQEIQKIGVFVNAAASDIAMAVQSLSLHGIQLHGDESPEVCAAVRSQCPDSTVWKVIGVTHEDDIAELGAYESIVDGFLFDTKTVDYGGSGTTFSWRVLSAYKGTKPFYLAGGIGPENCREAFAVCRQYGGHGIDINSRCEVSPGLKEQEKVRAVLACSARKEEP